MKVKDLADIVCDEMKLNNVKYEFSEEKEVGLATAFSHLDTKS